MTEATVEQRIRQLEDIEAIKAVTRCYAHAVNKGPNGKGLDLAAIPQIFTPGARWSSDELGTVIGATAIAAELPTATAMVEFSMQAFLNPSSPSTATRPPDRGYCGSPRSSTTVPGPPISAPT
jgi:hypothetical protein